jgi:hypothetical protein
MGDLAPLPPWASKEDVEKRIRYHMRLKLLLGACLGAATITGLLLVVLYAR